MARLPRFLPRFRSFAEAWCILAVTTVALLLYVAGIVFHVISKYSPALEVVSLFFMLSVMAVAFWLRPEMFLKGFFVFYSMLMAVPGLILINQSNYMQEIQTHGQAVNVICFLQLFAAISVFAFWVQPSELRFVKDRGGAVGRCMRGWNRVVAATALLVVSLNLFFFTKYGSNFGVDRFQLMQNADWKFRFYLTNQGVLVFIAVYAAARSPSVWRWGAVGATVLTSAILLFSIGVKFSGFVSLSVLCITSVYVATGIRRTALRALSLICVVAILSLVCFIVIPKYEAAGSQSGSDEVLRRTVGQSQLFWVAHLEFRPYVPIQLATNRTLGLFGVGVPDDSPGGIVELMREYAPLSVYRRYRERGVVFTFGYPAVLVFSLGSVLAPLAHFFLMNIYASAIGAMFRFAAKGNCGLIAVYLITLVLFVKGVLVAVRLVTNGDFQDIPKFAFVVVIMFLVSRVHTVAVD